MSSKRAHEKAAFLGRIGWAGARMQPLAGDASARRYERLSGGPGGAGAVLMDAPPQTCTSTAAFVKIAQHLTVSGFSAPRILHKDVAGGFLLLEDLGDDLFARVARNNPQAEQELYSAATDFLVAMHSTTPPTGLAVLGVGALARMIGVTFEWYCPTPKTEEKQVAMAAMAHALGGLKPNATVLALRDFHAENLIWLPERAGVARVGLLDFQDAFLGHPVYDLISLTRDARRDVSAETVRRTMARYIAATGQSEVAFGRAAATFAVQRNLRILGVFARLAKRDAKPAYLDYIPRVWGHLQRDLSHPYLADLGRIVLRALPPPRPEFLLEMREKCSTPPAPQ